MNNTQDNEFLLELKERISWGLLDYPSLEYRLAKYVEHENSVRDIISRLEKEFGESKTQDQLNILIDLQTIMDRPRDQNYRIP